MNPEEDSLPTKPMDSNNMKLNQRNQATTQQQQQQQQEPKKKKMFSKNANALPNGVLKAGKQQVKKKKKGEEGTPVKLKKQHRQQKKSKVHTQGIQTQLVKRKNKQFTMSTEQHMKQPNQISSNSMLSSSVRNALLSSLTNPRNKSSGSTIVCGTGVSSLDCTINTVRENDFSSKDGDSSNQDERNVDVMRDAAESSKTASPKTTKTDGKTIRLLAPTNLDLNPSHKPSGELEVATLPVKQRPPDGVAMDEPGSETTTVLSESVTEASGALLTEHIPSSQHLNVDPPSPTSLLPYVPTPQRFSLPQQSPPSEAQLNTITATECLSDRKHTNCITDDTPGEANEAITAALGDVTEQQTHVVKRAKLSERTHVKENGIQDFSASHSPINLQDRDVLSSEKEGTSSCKKAITAQQSLSQLQLQLPSESLESHAHFVSEDHGYSQQEHGEILQIQEKSNNHKVQMKQLEQTGEQEYEQHKQQHKQHEEKQQEHLSIHAQGQLQHKEGNSYINLVGYDDLLQPKKRKVDKVNNQCSVEGDASSPTNLKMLHNVTPISNQGDIPSIPNTFNSS